MPRAGWIAAGAATAAVAVTLGTAAHLSGFGIGVALVLLAMAGHVADTVAGGATGHAPTRGTALERTSRPAKKGSSAVGAVLVGIAALAIRVVVAGTGDPTTASSLPPDAGDGPWAARVVAMGSPRDGQQIATLDVDVGAAGAPGVGAPGVGAPGAGADSPPPAPLRVAATLPRYPAIRSGLRIRVSGPLEPLPDDDYGRYLSGTGVTATLRAGNLTVTGDAGDPGAILEAIRRSGDDALTRALPEPEAGLASGILIGLRDRVDRDLAAAFVAAGVSHVVAISGWNIAIVAAAIAALLRTWPRRRRSIAILLAIGLYTALTGASASVLRAAVMATVVLLARETGRPGRAAAALGWAVAGILVAGPGLVTDPGFALSAAATGGLIAWATPLTERLAGWRGGQLPGWLCASLGVSLAAEFATLPIALVCFGRIALIAPVVNLAVVPLVAPAMAAGAVALAGGGISAAGAPGIVATVLGLPAWAALTPIVAIVRAASVLPFASVTLEPPASYVAAAAAAAGILGVALRGRLPALRPRGGAGVPRRPVEARPRSSRGPDHAPRRRWTSRAARITAAALAVAVLGLVAAAVTRPDGHVRITVLDVGQGDAILVDGNRGSRMLVDGGPDPDRLLVALDAHVPPWDRRIDLVVLTHPHEDHVGGLALLLARYRVARVVEPGMRGPGPGYRAWVAKLASEGRTSGRLATGDRFSFDDVAFRVLWPDRTAVPVEPGDDGTSINNVSIVLLGTIGHERFLLTGDIEEGIDPILLGRGLPHVDVLKVAHHGSRTSSTGEFLDAVRPRIAVVSVGAKNTYGHPAPATLARLRDRHATVYRTDLDGTVVVTLDGQGATARAEGGRTAATEAPVATSRVGSPLIAFRCGIPRPGEAVVASVRATPATGAKVGASSRLAGTARASGGATVVAAGRGLSRWAGAWAGAPPTASRPALLYHRSDDGTRAGRRRRPPRVARPTALGAPPRTSGRRGRSLARCPDRGPSDRCRPAARGGGRAPPRRG
jgi:competence protein ComEC